MFNRFFKPGWKSAKPAKRINAIKRLDTAKPEHNDILKNLAMSDPSDEVRSAAVNSIVDIQWLSALLTKDAPDNLKKKTKNRIQQLLSSEDVSNDTSNSVDINVIDDPETLINIASHSKEQSVRGQAISQINDDGVLLKVISESKFHDARLAAAKQLTTIDAIEAAHRVVKNKDKVVVRLLHDQIKVHKAALQQEKQHDESVFRLLASMEALAKSQWSTEFHGRYLSLTQRWEKLESDLTNGQKNQFGNAAKTALSVVETHQKIEQTRQQQQEIVQKLPALHKQVMALGLSDLQTGIEGIDNSITEYEGAWNQSLAITSPEKKTSESYHRHFQSINKIRIVAKKAIGLPWNSNDESSPSVSQMSKNLDKIEQLLSQYKTVNESEQPEFIKQLLIDARDVRQSIKTANTVVKSASQSIDKQFRSLQSMLSSGKWGPANSIYQRLLLKLETLEDSARKRFDSRLAKAEERLNEIGDWKSFATAPKLEGLCEQMEAVPAMALNPRDRADWIKKLQDSWKAMGSSPESNNLWPRFKEAADKAYVPCAEYFDKKRQHREQNLENRRKVCDQLKTYLAANDWESPDWKLVQKTQRVAKQEWSQNRIVDRKPNKALEDQFTDLMRQFDEKLDVEYTVNAAEKQGLIEKVTALADGESNQHSLNQVKRYQLAWKQVGIMRRKEDQTLWETFNETCRRVYNANREIQKQAYEKSIVHVTEAKTLIKEMNALARNNELNENAFTMLQDKFQALPEFPDKDKKYLERDYQKAGDLFEKLQLKFLDAAELSSLDDLRRRSGICDQLDQLLFSIPDDVEQQFGALQEQWEDCDNSQKKRWLTAISGRYDMTASHLKAHTKPDYEKSDINRRMLCIELEILADAQTPAEDKALRMEYQLGQLQQGLKSGIKGQRKEQLLNMEVRWLCTNGASQTIALGLQDRFNATLEKAHSD